MIAIINYTTETMKAMDELLQNKLFQVIAKQPIKHTPLVTVIHDECARKPTDYDLQHTGGKPTPLCCHLASHAALHAEHAVP